jgi:sRNA-binding carbon storage regulator CsrA
MIDKQSLEYTLNEGDYIIIDGDTRVYFNYKTAQNNIAAIAIGIEAPPEIKVLRSKVYVDELMEAALDSGDERAIRYAQNQAKEQKEARRRNIIKREKQKKKAN